MIESSSQSQSPIYRAGADELPQPERFDEYLRLEAEDDRKFANQKHVDVSSVFPIDALVHYIDHPVDFIEDTFWYRDEHGYKRRVELDRWQVEVCNDLVSPTGGFEAIAAGSGVGKTFLLSKIIYWFLTTRRGVVPCTAPTEHQLFDILWKELKKDYDESEEIQKLFVWTQTKVFMRGHVATWYAVARTATVRKDGKVQEGLQGFHDANMLFIIDEASGVADSSMAAVDGALTAKNAKVIMTSNPTRLSGRFYNSFDKSSRMKGGPWGVWNIDCRDSRWVDEKYVSFMLLEHGEESAVFRSKVAGLFPDQEENTLISTVDFAAAVGGGGVVGVSAGGRKYTSDSIRVLGMQRDPEYSSRYFATQGHEVAALRFFARVGARGLIGRGAIPGAGYDRARFRPIDKTTVTTNVVEDIRRAA